MSYNFERRNFGLAHQTLKNCILLENYYLPGGLDAQIEAAADD